MLLDKIQGWGVSRGVAGEASWAVVEAGRRHVLHGAHPHESGVSDSNNEKRGTLERELAKLLVVTDASVHDG